MTRAVEVGVATALGAGLGYAATSSWWGVGIVAVAVGMAQASRPAPRRERTAEVAVERLAWVRAHDRIRTRDPRLGWLNRPAPDYPRPRGA